MHAACLINEEFKDGDNNGNKFSFLINNSDKKTNLHALYDSGLGYWSECFEVVNYILLLKIFKPFTNDCLDKVNAKAEEAVLNFKLSPNDKIDVDFTNWYNESHKIAEEIIYPCNIIII